MSHKTLARGAGSLAVAALLALAVSAPATARTDPGAAELDAPAPGLPYSQHAYENHYLSPLPVRVDAPPPVVTRLVDDGSLEVLQLGAGALSGIALATAVAGELARRRHLRTPRPA